PAEFNNHCFVARIAELDRAEWWIGAEEIVRARFRCPPEYHSRFRQKVARRRYSLAAIAVNIRFAVGCAEYDPHVLPLAIEVLRGIRLADAEILPRIQHGLLFSEGHGHEIETAINKAKCGIE